jgi:hypothetical protein
MLPAQVHRLGLALHADWSIDPRKRWMTSAHPLSSGWVLSAARPVGELAGWTQRLQAEAGDGAVAIGVDFPLGLPRRYAELHATEAADFPAFLRRLANHPSFFSVCSTLDDVEPARPFYPARGVAGMTRAAHAQALGLGGADGLSRACDRATALRPAGAPIFWTLGANQTGKAAISAWRDWLLPSFAAGDALRLWPFEGAMTDLLTPGAVVVAETYPAEAMRQRGLKLSGSKRRQSDRAALASALFAELDQRRAVPDDALVAEIRDGFGSDAAGEDRFDSLLGLLGLLAVLDGAQPDFIPDDPWIKRWEGWVLGQTELPRC